MRCLLPLLLTLVLLILAVEAGRPTAETPAPAQGVQTAFHVEPYLQLPAPDAMTVMWETAYPAIGKVEYGPTPALGRTAAERKPARLHQVRIEGLEPGRSYHYRVRCGELVSKVNVLRTAPSKGTPKWRMAAYGDSRSIPWIHKLVAEQIAKHNVDLVVHTGDIVANGKNYESWRREFFAPVACYAGSVPWVSTIGNHEADSENYFSYMALPGNERHWGFDYANAHIICLDSNGWLEKDGRDVKQRQWMHEHLRKPRDAAWTFVVFHHPLFSAHPTRPINKLRWEWTPLFLDPECRIDGVLNGHDHFYARCFPMSRLTDAADADGRTSPVMFLTTAGGGAPLYPVKQRDYIARTQQMYHFTLFEFDGDEIQLSAIDIAGRVIDRHVMKKNETAADWCAFEIEELKQALRKALVLASPVQASNDQPTRLDTVLEVPARENPFRVVLRGKLRWAPSPGWKLSDDSSIEVRPGEPIRIPLKAEVEPIGLTVTPALTIEFEPGRFRNNRIVLHPFKLTGSPALTASVATTLNIDGQLIEPVWQNASVQTLLPVTPGDKAMPQAELRLARSDSALVIGLRLPGAGKVHTASLREGAKSVLTGEHVRIELADERHLYSFAVSPDQLCYVTRDSKAESLNWPAAVAQGADFWHAELAVPLSSFSNPGGLRLNVVYRNQQTRREFELRPSFGLGPHPDLLPDWIVPERKDAGSARHFAGIAAR